MLKLALKKKVVEIETLKADLEDLRNQLVKLVQTKDTLTQVKKHFHPHFLKRNVVRRNNLQLQHFLDKAAQKKKFCVPARTSF